MSPVPFGEQRFRRCKFPVLGSVKTQANTATQLVSLFIPVDVSHGEWLKGREGRAEREAVGWFSSIQWRK